MDPDSGLYIGAFPVIQLIRIIFLLILLLCSALISGSEVALFSLSPSDLEESETRHGKTIKIIKNLLARPKKLLATILVVNNFINIAIVLLFAALGEYLFEGLTTVLWGFVSVRFIVEVGLVTFLILLFGEILPKIYASRNPISFSVFMAYPLQVFNKALFFINMPMRYVTLKIHDQFGSQKSGINVSHLSQALAVTATHETSVEEKRILQGIVSFGDTEARQVMRPRMDIFTLSSSESYIKVINLITNKGYSRVPVHENSLDNILGVLYVKDLLPHLNKKEFDWTQLIRKSMFIPENKKLDDLLTEFKEKKNHLAIVVDEYGGTSGLVALDDIIREIVGDISDEYDVEDLIYTKIDDLNYLFEGRTHLKDFYKVTKIKEKEVFEVNKGEAETLAGFLLEISSAFPRKGEKVKFSNYEFCIEAVDQKRIKKIKFSILDA